MWPNPQETGEILNGKLHFLCSASIRMKLKQYIGKRPKFGQGMTKIGLI